MRAITPGDIAAAPADTAMLGLFRREFVTNGPARTLRNLFADLRRVSRGEVIAEDPGRHLQGARLQIDHSEGHGAWELYRLDQDLYVVGTDGVYDTSRVETVPGEGLIEFHLRLQGVLEMALPGHAGLVTVPGESLLMMYQPPGVNISERLLPKQRDASMTLYCRPEILTELAHRNGIAGWPVLEEIKAVPAGRVWHRQVPLSPTLLYIGTSLLQSQYRHGIRLLHAEAKALELLCEVLTDAQDCEAAMLRRASPDSEARRLEHARRLVGADLRTRVRIRELARKVGMSESKLKRAFKARFGITIFDYGLQRRMRHALELLRCKQMAVGQVAFAVGYQHQTSFAAAFHAFFGFLPSKARTEMH